MSHTYFKGLKKGCPSAFADIHAKYSRRIFWYGKGFIRDDFVIETLVQDAFLKLWLHRDRIETPKHIYFFLRLVMKRECISYYTLPKNRFFRKMNSLESYDNYLDYLAGFDPQLDDETLKAQENEQQHYDRIQKILPLLHAESRHLIELCLKHDFAYKVIAQGMGTSITDTFNKVNKTIEAIKSIIDHEGVLETKQAPALQMNVDGELTKQQEEVMKLRCQDKQSFAAIATALHLSQEEVRREFMAAYTFLKDKHQHHQKSA